VTQLVARIVADDDAGPVGRADAFEVVALAPWRLDGPDDDLVEVAAETRPRDLVALAGRVAAREQDERHPSPQLAQQRDRAREGLERRDLGVVPRGGGRAPLLLRDFRHRLEHLVDPLPPRVEALDGDAGRRRDAAQRGGQQHALRVDQRIVEVEDHRGHGYNSTRCA